MTSEPFNTPVLFIIFKRPETTARVFEAIRKARPSKLFIAADGPRNAEEALASSKARAIVANIDWPCEVKTLFRKENMGMKYGVASAISWFFEQVEEGIILEDDCVPESTFFPYCQELLIHYRTDPRVMHITGTNVQLHNPRFSSGDSYYFSTIPNVWGWASWRRAWKWYDPEVSRWPEIKKSKFLYTVLESAAAYELGQKFQRFWEKKTNSWDGQWVFACLINRGWCICPSHNLITNIGYGVDATGTKISDPLWDSQPTEPMPLPLTHPKELRVDPNWERYGLAASYKINRHMRDRVKWWFKMHFTNLYLFGKKWYYKILMPSLYDSYVRDDEHLLMP